MSDFEASMEMESASSLWMEGKMSARTEKKKKKESVRRVEEGKREVKNEQRTNR